MSVVSRIFSFIMYADDTTLTSILITFQPSSPTESTDMMINNELDKISERLTVDQLSLNVPKTKFSIFHKKRKNIIPPEIKIQNIIIE